jgi:hypothetical protein
MPLADQHAPLRPNRQSGIGRSGATRSRAPNMPPKARHEAGYRSRICLINVEIRTELEKRVLYALEGEAL